MHVEVLVKDPTEIYACMIQVHKMASGIEGIAWGARATTGDTNAGKCAPECRHAPGAAAVYPTTAR